MFALRNKAETFWVEDTGGENMAVWLGNIATVKKRFNET